MDYFKFGENDNEFGVRFYHGNWIIVVTNGYRHPDEARSRVAVFHKDVYGKTYDNPYLVRYCEPEMFAQVIRDFVDVLDQEEAISGDVPF